MTDEQLQFAISQYVDGTLPPTEAAALEKRLKEDPAARKLLQEYRRINDLIDVALPAPEVDWDQLSTKISAAIDREASSSPTVQEQPATYRMWGYAWKPLAMAAAVLVCATVAVVAIKSGSDSDRPTSPVAVNPTAVSTETGRGHEPTAVAMANIQVLTAEKPAGQGVLEVQIGPPSQGVSTARLYPETSSDYSPSVSIAGDPSRMRDDEFAVFQ